MEKHINNFNISRTIGLIKKQMIEQRKTNIMSLVVLFGSLIVLSLIIGATQKYPPRVAGIDHAIVGEQVLFTIMLFILGSIYVSTAFNSLIHKTGRISMLSLPANSSEKFLAHWFLYVFLFLILYFCAIWAADATRVIVMRLSHTECGFITFMKWDDIFNTEGSATIALFLLYQSFFLLGSIVWPRYSFIKTYFALTALSTLFFIICGLCVTLLLKSDRVYMTQSLDNINPLHVIWYLTGSICLINYFLTYLRLRESEIINRF